MKRIKLLKSTPGVAPEIKSADVLAVCQTIELDGKSVLNIDLFYMGQLKARYFADKEEDSRAVFVNDEWKTCKIDNAARICRNESVVTGDSYYYGGYVWRYATRQDEEIVTTYFDTTLDYWEIQSDKEKRATAIERKQRRIDERMAAVPCVSEDMGRWVKQVIFPENILFVEKNEKRVLYSCTCCGEHGWKKNGWKHKEKTECPKCGQPAVVNTRKTEMEQTKPVIILQECGNQWVERQFKAVCRWEKGAKNIELYEQVRALIPKGECRGKVYYGQDKVASEFEQTFGDTNPMNKKFVESYLYPGNLQDVLKCGNLERSGLDILAENKVKINVNKFITTFQTRPWIEYFIKAGLTRIVAEIIDWYGWNGDPDCLCTDGQRLQEVLRLDGNRVTRMKQINGGLYALEWLQYEKTAGIRITQESLQYLSEKRVSLDDCEKILKELGSVNRMVNYLKKQRERPSRLWGMWRDYLRMAQNEGYDTTDDAVRLPKDLKGRHDQLVDRINARRDAERIERNREKYQKLDELIAERLPEVTRYLWQNDDYIIVPAAKCEELIAESRKLHHCVGTSDTYMCSMAEGRTWICFLRKKKEPEKAYYTLEIRLKDDNILQWYSEINRKPDKAIIKNVLDEYKRSIKQRCRQVQVSIAATV